MGTVGTGTTPGGKPFGRPKVYKAWFFEVCTRFVEVFGKTHETELLKQFKACTQADLRELVTFYFERSHFEEESFPFIQKILTLNAPNVDWDMVYKGMMSNFHFIKFLCHQKELLNFYKFLVTTGRSDNLTRITRLFGLCKVYSTR
jgi:hypothetical protein